MGEKLYARSATLYNNKYIPVRNFRRRTLRELNHCVYTIPEEIWGLLVVYVFCPFLSFTETNWWTCLNSICTLSSGSQILKHLLNYRPFYLFYLFFFSREQNFPINVAIRKATEWRQRDLSLKFHIMASWQCDFKTKLSKDENLTIVS